MMEAARSACLAALQAVEAAIEAMDNATNTAPTNGAEDYSHLTFDDSPAPQAPIRRKNGQR